LLLERARVCEALAEGQIRSEVAPGESHLTFCPK
jgi:hypothetical protein